MNMTLQTATFTLDALSGRVFEGYATAEQWNGWERPLFPFESARQITQAASEYQTAFYDEDADEFVFEIVDGETERFGAVAVAGVGKLYSIGAGVWIWERHE